MQFATRRIRTVALLSLPVLYGIYVGYIFNYRHIRVPPGNYLTTLSGRYLVSKKTDLQIPEVFRDKEIAISIRGGTYWLKDSTGREIALEQGADGLYFSQSFQPVGAWILPGIARNWNEGRISIDGDRLLINGKMIQMGLMLFIFPFRDATDWNVTFHKAPNNAMDRSRGTHAF